MRPNATDPAGVSLTKRQEQAALLVAADERSDADIAAACMVHKATLERWKQLPAFGARIAEHRQRWRDELTAKGIADRQNRVAAANDRWRRLQAIIEARAASRAPLAWHTADDDHPERLTVPGWETGLLVETVRRIGKVVEFRYEVDSGLLDALLKHEKQVAQDMGQWTEKQELAGDANRPVVIEVTPVDYRAAAAALAPLSE